MKRMNVALAFDDKYLKYAYVTILSLFINNPDSEIYTYILQYDLTDQSIDYLESLAEKYDNHIVLISIDPNRFDGLPTLDKWPIQVYFRLLLPEYLPSEVDRIIYLDSDMVINMPLNDLYNIDFEENDIISCYDLNLTAVDLDVFLYNRNEALAPLFKEKRYINSGMLLLNINQIRNNYSLESYLVAAKELNFKILAPDQDLINYVHSGKIKLVDPRKYNYPGYYAYLEGVTSDTADRIPIMHFVCEKPWQGGNHAHFETELIWWNYAFKTPFKDFLVETYIRESVTDPTIMRSLNGTDSVKNSLVAENARLKKELNNAMDQVKKVIALLNK